MSSAEMNGRKTISTAVAPAVKEQFLALAKAKGYQGYGDFLRLLVLQALTADTENKLAASKDFHVFTCGVCHRRTNTNLPVDEVMCGNCEARRCPHCGLWFNPEKTEEEEMESEDAAE